MGKYSKFSLATLVIIGAITSCGSSSKDATKENFMKVLDNYHQEKGCIIASLIGDDDFLEGVTVSLRRPDDAKQHDALVEVGILQSQDGVTEEPFRKTKIPTKTYTLTEEGKKIYQTEKNHFGSSSGFCVAKYKVSEVLNFSEPSVISGYTVSHVTYSAVAQDVASWASNKNFQKAFTRVAEQLQGEQQQKATLVLLDSGWVHEKELDLKKPDNKVSTNNPFKPDPENTPRLR